MPWDHGISPFQLRRDGSIIQNAYTSIAKKTKKRENNSLNRYKYVRLYGVREHIKHSRSVCCTIVLTLPHSRSPCIVHVCAVCLNAVGLMLLPWTNTTFGCLHSVLSALALFSYLVHSNNHLHLALANKIVTSLSLLSVRRHFYCMFQAHGRTCVVCMCV